MRHTTAATPLTSAARPRRRARRATAATLAALALASGCGSGGAGSGAESSPPEVEPIDLGGAAPGDQTTRSAPTALGEAVTRPIEVNRTVWVWGYEIEVKTAAMKAGERTLLVEGVAENTGWSTGELSLTVQLEQNGITLVQGKLQAGTPVQAGSRAAITMTFEKLPPSFDPTVAQIVLSNAKYRQIRIPLQGDRGLVDGKPRIQPAAASLKAGRITVTTETIELRTDDPSHHEQAPNDKVYVVVRGSVAFEAITDNVLTENISLTPANGVPQGPRDMNLLPPTGTSVPLYAVFVMPAPLGGDYTLQVKGAYSFFKMGYERPSVVSADAVFRLDAFPPSGGKDGAGS